MIHAVYFSLISVKLFYQIASASAQTFYYLIIKPSLMQIAHSFNIRAATPCITHISYYFFDIRVLHGYMLFDCDDIR